MMNQLFTEDSTMAAVFQKTSVFDFKELNPVLEKYDLVTDAKSEALVNLDAFNGEYFSKFITRKLLSRP